MRPTRDILGMIDDPKRMEACVAFYDKNEKLMKEMPASSNKHHKFVGGYHIHIEEVMNNALNMMTYFPMGEVDFTLDDVIIASFVHDVDKLWYRYELDTDKPSDAQMKYARDIGCVLDVHETKSSISAKIDAQKSNKPLDPLEIAYFKYKEGPDFDDSAIVCRICYENGITLTDAVLCAVTWHHGGWANIAVSNRRAHISKLGAMIHAADLFSAYLQNGRAKE